MRIRHRASGVVAVALVALAAHLLLPESPPHPSGEWLRTAGLEPAFEQVEGLRVRYVRKGSGSAIVLLHGFGASLYTWRDVLPGLAADHEVIALDFPGFGGSDQPADLSWDLYPRVVPALMDRLGVERAVLIGHSMGGAVAAALSAARPERVLALVLIDSAGYNLAPKDRPWLLRLSTALPALVMDRLPRRALVRRGLTQVFHDQTKVTAEVVEEYLAPLGRPGAQASIRSLLSSRNDAAAERIQQAIGQVRTRTLIVWGRHDAWAPVEQSQRFARAIPGSQVVVLEDCGHMPQEERPDTVLTLVRGFLEQVEKGGYTRRPPNEAPPGGRPTH